MEAFDSDEIAVLVRFQVARPSRTLMDNEKEIEEKIRKFFLKQLNEEQLIYWFKYYGIDEDTVCKMIRRYCLTRLMMTAFNGIIAVSIVWVVCEIILAVVAG